MATPSVSRTTDAVITEIHLGAPPERVFQALIDPKQVIEWWRNELCEIESFEMEPKAGGRWRYDTKQSGLNVNRVSKFHCDGEVLECDPPRVLRYTWIANWHDDKMRRTTVRRELTPEAGGTHLKVTHSGLAQEATARRDYSGGWPGVVDQLKKFVETMGGNRT